MMLREVPPNWLQRQQAQRAADWAAHIERLGMLTLNQYIDQLKLQDRLNSVVNPQWMTAGNAWTTAAWIEAGEALEHWGWKWWKKQERNLPQVHIELVDIWHFILSHRLEATTGDTLEAAAGIRAELRGASTADMLQFPVAISAFASAAAAGVLNMGWFLQSIRAADLSWQELHRLYLGKNLLNLFRQAHGYREGTYVKEWNPGQEDNVVLEKLMINRPGATPTEIMNHLEAIYEDVLAGRRITLGGAL